MPIDPQAARLLAMLGAARPTDWPGVSAAARRDGFAALMRMAGTPPAVASVSDVRIAGAAGPLPARLYAPRDGTAPGLVYFHGGGLVAGDLDTHDALCRALAAGSDCRVLSVGYRLAPEHPFPAAAEDAVAAAGDALGRAAEFGLDPARVAVGGDSAGGTLATLAAGALRTRVALQLLLCPALDAAPDTESRRLFARGHLLDAAMMARDLADCAPGALDLADPRLSPLRDPDLAGRPPALIHTAEFDPLRDEGALYAERLAAAGVPVRHRCHPGMIHHFYGLTGLVPAARAALADIAAELGARLAMG
ncbi:alpha/beta hydrolase [Lichenibacterium dinghuense]|uniref:alpha/beta hydrolase n=1 Tax=Lichenibacterium dinghuense TaxID=2895977 RepID=UPI001F394F29|nr:alpha/beta hydrolase [Lichenibacterium sp. 6Y81]